MKKHLLALAAALAMLLNFSCQTADQMSLHGTQGVIIQPLQFSPEYGWDDYMQARIDVPADFNGRIIVHYFDSTSVVSTELDNNSYENLSLQLSVLLSTINDSSDASETNTSYSPGDISIVRFLIDSEEQGYGYRDVIIESGEFNSDYGEIQTQANGTMAQVLYYICNPTNSKDWILSGRASDRLRSSVLPDSIQQLTGEFPDLAIFLIWLEVVPE